MISPPRTSLVLLPVAAPPSPAVLAAALAALAEVPGGGEVLLLDPGGGAGLAGVRPIPVDRQAGRGAWLAAGAAAAAGEVLVFLHADAEPQPGFLAPLLEALRRDGVAVAGPRLVEPGGASPSDGLILTYGRPWPVGVASQGDSTANAGRRAPLEVAAVPDVALAVTSARLAALGGFDAAFRAGGAAVDLCLRAGEAGLRTLVVRRSLVVHPPGCPAAAGDEPLLGRRWIGKVPLFDADRLRQQPPHPPRPGRPGVSVVVPAPGAAALPRFLEPVLGCLGADDELVVAGAGAEDGTAEYLEVLARDARIPIRHVRDGAGASPAGPPAARLAAATAAALAAATRPMVAVLHPAAAPPPELLDEVTRFLEAQAGVAVVAFPVQPAGVVACGQRGVLQAVGAASPQAFFASDAAPLGAAVRAAGAEARLVGG